jgi:hypothetical protein
MRTSQDLDTRPQTCSAWRRRQVLRRRKERGRLIVAVLEHLYGEEQARIMWGNYLKSKVKTAQTEQVS